MTRMQIALSVLAMALTSAPAFSNDFSFGHNLPIAMDEAANRRDLNDVIDHSRKVQFEASEMRDMLKAKSPDLKAVSAKLDLLARHTSEMRQRIALFEATHESLTPAQRYELQQMKNVAAIIDAFVTGKKQLLAASDAGRKTRLLRAKAEAIAKRAELVEKSALRIRS